jgi:hypothetical protein
MQVETKQNHINKVHTVESVNINNIVHFDTHDD